MKVQGNAGGCPTAVTRPMRHGAVGLLLFALALAALTASAATARAGECPNEQLRAESNVNPRTGRPYSLQLPACRAYELVSPPETGGYPAASVDINGRIGPLFGARIAQITPGGKVFYVSRATPAGTGAIPNGRSLNVFLSERGASGWSTDDLTPFAMPNETQLIAGAPDGSSALIVTSASLAAEDLDNPKGLVPPQGGVVGAYDLYVVSRTGAPRFVSHGELPRVFPGREIGLQTTESGGRPPYEFNSQLSAIAFVMESVPLVSAASSSANDCYSWSDTGARFAVLTNPDRGSSKNCELLGMTPGGRPILRDASGDADNGLIYVDSLGVEGVEFPGGSVPAVQLSAPASTPTAFDTVSPDGSLAYVTTEYPLGAQARGGESNVYAVNIPTFPQPDASQTPGEGGENTVVCLSCQVGGGGPAQFMGQSEDGSHIFFTVAEAGGESAGHPYKGLWSWDRETEVATRLGEATDVAQLVISQNGLHAVGLTRQLANNPHGTADVYEFTAGEAPTLITSGTAADSYRLSQPLFEGQAVAGAVSDGGGRVVYDDLPPSVAGKQPPEVVEEWNDGETAELSPAGAEASYAVLGTAGPELEEVFFLAQEPLVASDENAGTQDIYDARVAGGFPRPAEAVTANTNANPLAPGIQPYTSNLAPPYAQPSALAGSTANPPAPASRPLSTAQKLAKALKACRKDKRRSTRRACEKAAHKKYATKKTKKGKR